MKNLLTKEDVKNVVKEMANPVKSKASTKASATINKVAKRMAKTPTPNKENKMQIPELIKNFVLPC